MREWMSNDLSSILRYLGGSYSDEAITENDHTVRYARRWIACLLLHCANATTRPFRPGSHYDVLGVPSDADEPTIKKAYRSIALKCHPDKFPADRHSEKARQEATLEFEAANEAFSVLSDPTRRLRYDRLSASAYTRRPGPQRSSDRPCADVGDSIAHPAATGERSRGDDPGAPHKRSRRSTPFARNEGSTLLTPR